MLTASPPAARWAVALAAGLALADASVVVLALPPILVDLDASVEGVAAVIGVYTLALALALPAATRLAGTRSAGALGPAAMVVFAAASVGCGLAPSLELLIVLRAVQGMAAAAVLVAAFDLLRAGNPGGGGRSLWVAAAVVGAAIGPAFGGVLTELFDWRAIFLAQAPVMAAAALASRLAAPGAAPRKATTAPSALPPIAALCLGLLAAALTGVLFLLVLLLISGWALSPLEGAAVVSVLPLAAFAGTRVPGDDASRAITGCALVGGGVLCLALLTVDSAAMTIVPQVIAGVGMGMALPALAGGLLPERNAADAARLLAIRHLGITLALVILAPVAAAQLDQAAEKVREQGTALILDARLPPLDKLGLADVATADLDAIAPRDQLRDALADARGDIAAGDRGEYDRLSDRADETLVTAVNEAFRPAFIICAVLALAAALGLLVSVRSELGRMALGLTAAAAATVPIQAIVAEAVEPEEVVIADPCDDRDLPSTGGLEGLLQDGALVVLDEAACRLGYSREELALALVDEERTPQLRRDLPPELRPLLDLLERLRD